VLFEDSEIIISTNRGEPLVLKKKLSLSGIAFENAARRLVGKQDYFDLNAPYKGLFAQFVHSIKKFSNIYFLEFLIL
jgi:septum formation inhibitor-activating ATPase MinD